MPRSYPPYSTQRHSTHNPSDRRSHSGSREKQVRSSRFLAHNNGNNGQRERRGKWPRLRTHLVAMTAEFIGTVLFLWFAFAGTQVASMSNPSGSVLQPQGIVYISLSFGMSLLVVAWAMYRISGGLFNPAVTCGMMVCGALPPMRGLFLIPAQLIAGIVAAALVSCMLPGPLAVVTTLTAGTSIAQGVFIEMFLTALLVFVILMLAAEKSSVTPVAPIGIGLALFVAELAGVYFTGGSLNPARSFGPSVVARSFPGYHWIYWLGPVMGGVLAGGYYKWLRYMNYEQVNPGQDATSEQEKIQVTSRTQSQMDMEV